MTTTPNPPASIESLRDLELLYAAACHYAAEWPIDWLPSSAYARLRAALSELEGLRSERLHWLAKSAEEVSSLRADLATATKAKEEAEQAADERHARLVILADDYRAVVARADALGARVEALEKNGHHNFVCTRIIYPEADEPCNCGWQKALSSTPTADLAARDARVRREALDRVKARFPRLTAQPKYAKGLEIAILGTEPTAPDAGEKENPNG